MLVCFLGLAAGLASGFQWTNTLFVLVLVPVLWKTRSLLTLALAVAVGVIARPQIQQTVAIGGGVFQGEAVVINVPLTQRDSIVMVVQAGSKRYRIRLPATSDVNQGDRILINAEIVPLSNRAVRQRLEVGELRPQEPVTVVSRGFWGWRWGMAVRRGFMAFVEQNADIRVIGLVEALALNVTGELSDATVEDLKTSGTIHIVSASGLHVTIVSVAIAWFLLALPVPRWAQLAVLAVGLTVYATAAGFHPPMFRSVVMVMAFSVAYLFAREPDALSALALSGVANVAMEPEAVASMGFLLSYTAVAALLLFGSDRLRLSEGSVLQKVKNSAFAAAQTSTVATIGTAPLLAYIYGQVPLISILSNLLVIPVIPIIVVGSLVCSAVWPIWPGLAVGGLKLIVEPLTGWIMQAVQMTGSLNWAVLKTPPFSPYWLLPIYLCLAALYKPTRRAAIE